MHARQIDHENINSSDKVCYPARTDEIRCAAESMIAQMKVTWLETKYIGDSRESTVIVLLKYIILIEHILFYYTKCHMMYFLLKLHESAS